MPADHRAGGCGDGQVGAGHPPAAAGCSSQLVQNDERRALGGGRRVPVSVGAPTEGQQQVADLLTPLFGRRAATGDGERHPAGVPIEVLGAQRKSPDDVIQQRAGVLPGADAGSGAPTEQWREQISDLLLSLGWRTDQDSYAPPPAHSPTLDVLEELAGAARTGWRATGTDLAVAATARSVIRQR